MNITQENGCMAEKKWAWLGAYDIKKNDVSRDRVLISFREQGFDVPLQAPSSVVDLSSVPWLLLGGSP